MEEINLKTPKNNENTQDSLKEILNTEKIDKNEKEKKNGFKKFFKIFSYLTVFIIIAFVLFSNKISISENNDSFLDRIPIISQIRHLVKSSDKKLKNEETGRVNILLLGIGGRKHEGGLLTDTIMLVSLDTKEKKVALLSLPRDMSIPAGRASSWTKINNINAFAEVKEKNSGGLAISQALSDVLDIPIDYYVRIDFEGFVNIVNKLGGLDVYVENTLEDYRYPVSGMEDAENYESRFEHLYLEKGIHKMNGELALKYARSRHALGIEGSDFARAKRQQLILQAAKSKLLKTNFLLRPKLITDIIGELNEHISTNFKIWEIIKLWNTFKDIEKDSIISKVLDNSPNGLLYNIINEQGSYVLLPRSGDFEEIKYFVHNIFNEAPPEKKEEVAIEKATLEVRNGTWVNGLAGRIAVDLEKYGFEVLRVGNSSQRNFEKSFIYDLTFGEKINSLTILKDKTDASVSFELPEWLKDDIAKDLEIETNTLKPDFILIIGQDADSTKSGLENIEQ